VVVIEIVEMMVLVTEPATTLSDGVRIVCWPLIVVVVAEIVSDCSVAGTTEYMVSKEGTTVDTIAVETIGFVATGTEGRPLQRHILKTTTQRAL